MKKQILVLMISVAAVTTSAFAQQTSMKMDGTPGWYKIAETIADLTMDRDEVVVLGADHYQSIQLKVTDNALKIQSLTVVFENDEQQNIAVRSFMNAGEQTRVIELDGNSRAIKKIIILYKTVRNAQYDKSHLEIWGLK